MHLSLSLVAVADDPPEGGAAQNPEGQGSPGEGAKKKKKKKKKGGGGGGGADPDFLHPPSNPTGT